MPKHKKTLKQKMLADKRRDLTPSPLYSLSSESLKQQSKPSASHIRPTVNISTTSYQYLTHDLRKTTLTTAIIVAIELVIFYFTRGV